jgi:hypothetical protein
MGWRDFQMDTSVHYVHKVHKETADSPLIGLNVLNVQRSDIENEIKHSPDRGKSIQEATRLYRKRGWVQIFSGHLNQSIYLVKNNRVKVPDLTLSKYTRNEIEALKGLSWEETRTLHEAKILFNGEIL